MEGRGRRGEGQHQWFEILRAKLHLHLEELYPLQMSGGPEGPAARTSITVSSVVDECQGEKDEVHGLGRGAGGPHPLMLHKKAAVRGP